jgi:hypothetical protein
MPNWCINFVSFRFENQEKATSLYDKFYALQSSDKGEVPENCQCVDGYLFDVVVADQGIFQVANETSFEFGIVFSSRWAPINETLINIAKTYDAIGFECEYSETGNMVYGKFFYDTATDNTLDQPLSDDDFDKYVWNEETENYTYNGVIYESDEEILELIHAEKYPNFFKS